ncbi:MAG: hypothetical protein IIA40_09995 [SAR324 cluster bacterium]|nr:hypothetical protein [SAR324 cluster bacterium]
MSSTASIGPVTLNSIDVHSTFSLRNLRITARRNGYRDRAAAAFQHWPTVSDGAARPHRAENPGGYEFPHSGQEGGSLFPPSHRPPA